VISGQGPEENEATGEIILSEKEIRESIKAVTGVLSSLIGLSSGGGAVETIIRGLNRRVDKGLLDQDLEGLPEANKNLVERFLRELATGLREKS